MSQSNTDPSIVSIASPAQRRANRANAKKSTGPRTAEGKRRSSQNAATHGIFCKDAVLPGERRGEFVAFRNLLFTGLKPQDWLECSIADQYVLAKWRMRRAAGAERLVHNEVGRAMIDRIIDDVGLIDPPRGSNAAHACEMTAVDRDVQRRHRRAHHLLVAASGPPCANPDVRATMASSFVEHGGDDDRGDGAFERVAKYVHRLELSADRALRELRQLRKERGVDVSALVDCPFIDDVPEDEDDNKDDDEQLPDLANAGVSTPTVPSHDEPPAENEQNEPNFRPAIAGPDADRGCDQGTCNVEPIRPQPLAPTTGQRTRPDEGSAIDAT
ncbi:MAG: hypothetical protein M3478_12520 [Planctomycetota bacterium]|nr:hypothetical protein [Planctomycetota bacterium]